MTDRILSQWPEWRDRAIIELRMKDVPGDDIGEILTEVETHVQETGESPNDAFGDPATYARERAASVNVVRSTPIGLFLTAISSAIGGFILAHSAWRLGAGEPALEGIPAWIGVLLGATIMAFVFGRIKADLIIDPRSGRSMDSVQSLRIFVIGTFGGAAVVLALAGWFLVR